jgi:beta-glucosidase
MGQELLNKQSFGSDFSWGVSSSSLQSEGAAAVDEKGKSIWDEFAFKKGRIKGNHSPAEACDFYHRFEDDIRLMESMNIKNFRFSISWPRLFPDGFVFNEKGAAFYDKVIDCCLMHGIIPWITLYHWDLPLELEKKGGWTNRNIIYWFEKYAYTCVKRYGDRVRHWMILNEPLAFTGAGYFLGIHAPGKKGLGNFLPAMHHAVMTLGSSSRMIKQLWPSLEVGSTFSSSHITPFSNSDKNILAAKRVDVLLNKVFSEASLGKGYPFDDLPMLRGLPRYIKSSDELNMKADLDFVGIQNYTREVVKHSWLTPYLRAKIINAKKRGVETTAMNWEVYPEGIYEILKKFAAYPFVKKIIVTENGASFNDVVKNGSVNDQERMHFIQSYLKQVLRAKQEGVPVDGYFIWSFTDNFEWSEGYNQRFGLVHVDYKTQQRIVKDSGKWYADFLGQQEKKVNNAIHRYSITELR